MSCCTSTTLVAPDGTPVLVVDDGAGNVTYTDLNTDAAYAGDISLLTVPEVGGATVVDNTDFTTTITGVDTGGTVTSDTVINRLDDCENNAIDVGNSTFVTWEQLQTYNRGHVVPFVDSGDGCTPADIVDCPANLIAHTTSPSNDLWTWEAGAWTLTTLSDGGGITDVSLPPFSQDDATLGAIETAAIGTDVAVLESVPLLNDDCVPWVVEHRVQGGWLSQFNQDNRFVFLMFPDTAANGHAPNLNDLNVTNGVSFIHDTRPYAAGPHNLNDIRVYKISGVLMPGVASTVRMTYNTRRREYVSATANFVTYQTMTIETSWRRVRP